MAGWPKGEPLEESHREKISQRLRGRKRGPQSEEHRERLSESVSRYYRQRRERRPDGDDPSES